MAVKRWINLREQFFDTQGNPLNGGKLFFYTAGSSAKLNTYNSSTGVTANSNPLILDAFGRLQAEIWLTSGSMYKAILTTSTDTDPPVSPIWSEDNISGVNDTTTTLDQWIAGPTPTYVSATSFTLVGDQTSLFEKGRAVKVTDSGGTKFGWIKTSVFGALTTIVLDQNSQALATPTTAVSYGITSATSTSSPIQPATTPLRADATDESKQVALALSGITTGNTRTLTVQDRSGTVALTTDFTPGFGNAVLLPNDYISGFALTNNGTTGFDVALGQANDSTNATPIVGSAIVNKTQSAWAVGTAAGGKLSAAAMANATWYYWFALWKTADGTVDYGFDVATTPTLPSGYSKYRYIGARKTGSGTTNWATFIQHGDEVYWSTPPTLDLNTNNPGTAAVTVALNVPSGLKVKALFNATVANNDATALSVAACYFSDLAVADVAPALNSPLASLSMVAAATAGTTNFGTPFGVWTNTSSQIRYRMTASTVNITVAAVAIGWIDPRGKPV